MGNTKLLIKKCILQEELALAGKALTLMESPVGMVGIIIGLRNIRRGWLRKILETLYS